MTVFFPQYIAGQLLTKKNITYVGSDCLASLPPGLPLGHSWYSTASLKVLLQSPVWQLLL